MLKMKQRILLFLILIIMSNIAIAFNISVDTPSEVYNATSQNSTYIKLSFNSLGTANIVALKIWMNNSMLPDGTMSGRIINATIVNRSFIIISPMINGRVNSTSNLSGVLYNSSTKETLNCSQDIAPHGSSACGFSASTLKDYINFTLNGTGPTTSNRNINFKHGMYIAGWVKRNNFIAGTGFIAKTDNIPIYYGSDGATNMIWGASAGSDLSFTLNDNKWHYIEVIENKSKNFPLRVYIDGKLNASASVTGANQTKKKLVFGDNEDGNGQQWHGSLSYFIVTNMSIYDMLNFTAFNMIMPYRGEYGINITLMNNTNITYEIWALNSAGVVNTTGKRYLMTTSPSLVPAANDCTCPVSGDWTINDGSICTLTSTCYIYPNNFIIENGEIHIEENGQLTANKCIINYQDIGVKFIINALCNNCKRVCSGA